MPRILFLKTGTYFIPSELPTQGKYLCLSKHFSGDIFAVVNTADYKNYQIGNFSLIGLNLPKKIRHSFFRNIIYAFFAIIMATYRHYFKSRYDAIIAYDPLMTGVIGLIINKFTDAKLIVEINGNYESAFKLDSASRNFIGVLKHRYSHMIIPFIVKHANGIKLVYEKQLLSFKIATTPADKLFVFPNFVPISQFKPGDGVGKYILFMGFPWHLKGVDILIKAFNNVSLEFPDYTLKIVGYCPDKTEYIRLCQGNSRIQLCDPVWYEDAIKLISECTIFVLPSRTDSSPRVLREAMAAKKPIIASNVDGIPTLIMHGVNGLLFESENVNDLADKLRTIISNPNYARKLAEDGHRYVYSVLSEECYARDFNAMLEKVLTQ